MALERALLEGSLLSACGLLTFQGDDLAGWVHDGAVCRDGPADGVVGVGHVNDDHLGLLAHLLPHADELVRLHGQRAESDVGRVDSQVLELKYERKRSLLTGGTLERDQAHMGGL